MITITQRVEWTMTCDADGCAEHVRDRDASNASPTWTHPVEVASSARFDAEVWRGWMFADGKDHCPTHAPANGAGEAS